MRARFVERTACIFDFEIRNKQMFTEARAFSRVTYFFYFLASQLDFFLNLHSEISYPTPFSERCKEMTQLRAISIYSVAKRRLKYGKRQPVAMEEKSRLIQKKQPFLYIVMVRVYHRRFGVPESICKFMCYAIPFLFVYLIDPEARTYTV